MLNSIKNLQSLIDTNTSFGCNAGPVSFVEAALVYQGDTQQGRDSN
jgi:hypothetical protein